MDEPLNLVLFSGTDDKLQAAAVLTAGAAALGKPVNIFLQYWALDAFRADRIGDDHGLAPEAGAGRPRRRRRARGGRPGDWAETLRQAKDLGGVDIQACSLSMDLLHLEPDRPRPARRRGRRRDRLLPQRRRGPGRLHLSHESGRRLPCQSSRSPRSVDARGLSCPMPIVKTAQAVKPSPSGAVVELLATDAGSIKDVAAWCRDDRQRAHRADIGWRGLPLRHPPEVRHRHDHRDTRPVRPARRRDRRRRRLAGGRRPDRGAGPAPRPRPTARSRPRTS